MKKPISIFLMLFMLSSILVFVSCKKQKNTTSPNEVENELITTLRLSYMDTLSKDSFQFTWKQLGGPGTAITVDTIKLLPNRVYSGKLELLDESKTPAFQVTEEIKSLANEHRFIYTTSATRYSSTITDFDSHTPPIELGLQFLANTSDSGLAYGQLVVLLKHYTESSPKTLGPSAGTTDIEVRFPIRIE